MKFFETIRDYSCLFFHRRIVEPCTSASSSCKHLWNYIDVHLFKNWVFFPLSEIEETGRFLIEIMPLMFIPAAVGLLEAWDIIRSVWILYLVVTIFSTIFVMAVLWHDYSIYDSLFRFKKSSVKKSFVCQGRGM